MENCFKVIPNRHTVDCPICGSSKRLFLGDRDEILSNTLGFYKFCYRDVICEVCLFVYSANRQDHGLIAEYYSYYHVLTSNTSEDEHRKRFSVLAPYISFNSTIYEIGGGAESNFSNWLIAKGYNIVNLEVHTDWPEEGKADLILSYYVVEHINELSSFMRRLWGTLKVGGYFIFEVPDFLEFPAESLNEEHVNHFTEHSLKALAVKNGFLPVVIDGSLQSRYFGLLVIFKKIDKKSGGFWEEFHSISNATSKIHRQVYNRSCGQRKNYLALIRGRVIFAKKNNLKILVWGFNQNAIRLIFECGVIFGFEIVDSCRVKQNLSIRGERVRSPETIQNSENIFIFVCASAAFNEIYDFLVDLKNIDKKNIFKVHF